MLDRGLIQPPPFVQLIFGILGGIGTDTEDLMHMKRTADRLFGGQYLFSILAAGRHQMRFGTIGAIMGGNCNELRSRNSARFVWCSEIA